MYQFKKYIMKQDKMFNVLLFRTKFRSCSNDENIKTLS